METAVKVVGVQPRSLSTTHVLDRLIEIAFRVYAVLVYAFLYVPIAVVVIFSFNDSRFVQAWQGFTTAWYGRAWSDVSILNSLRVSLTVAPINTVLATALGTLLALGLRHAPRLVVVLLLAVVYMTIVTPELVTGLAALLYFVKIGEILGIKNILGIFTLVVTHVVFNSAIVALIVRARLAGMDETLNEASADLGATPWGTFWQITVPLLMPAIIAGALLAFTFSFDDFVISFFVSGPQSTTLPIRIFSMVRFGVSPIVNPVATVLLAFTLTSVFLAQYILTRENASFRPLIIWFAFVVGVIFYSLGPGQAFWARFVPLNDLFRFLTFILAWFLVLYGLSRVLTRGLRLFFAP